MHTEQLARRDINGSERNSQMRGQYKKKPAPQHADTPMPDAPDMMQVDTPSAVSISVYPNTAG